MPIPGLTCKYHPAIPAERYWWFGPSWGRFKSAGHLDLCGTCVVQRQAVAVEAGDSLYTDQQCRSRVQVPHEPRADGSATAKPGPRLDAPTPNAEPETVPQPLDPGVGAGVEGHLSQEIAMPTTPTENPTCTSCGKIGPLKAKDRCPKCYDRQYREAKKSKLAPKPGRLPPQRGALKLRAVAAAEAMPTPPCGRLGCTRSHPHEEPQKPSREAIEEFTETAAVKVFRTTVMAATPKQDPILEGVRAVAAAGFGPKGPKRPGSLWESAQQLWNQLSDEDRKAVEEKLQRIEPITIKETVDPVEAPQPEVRRGKDTAYTMRVEVNWGLLSTDDFKAMLTDIGFEGVEAVEAREPQPNPTDRQRLAASYALRAMVQAQGPGGPPNLSPEWGELLRHLERIADGYREWPL